MLFCTVLYTLLFNSFLFHSILFYSILFYSILLGWSYQGGGDGTYVTPMRFLVGRPEGKKSLGWLSTGGRRLLLRISKNLFWGYGLDSSGRALVNLVMNLRVPCVRVYWIAAQLPDSQEKRSTEYIHIHIYIYVNQNLTWLIFWGKAVSDQRTVRKYHSFIWPKG
jgi:hypothetical protein